MSLNDRQRDELHNALLEYLLGRDEFAEAATVFQRAAGIAAPPAAAAPGRGLLEKKWTSVVRLQKKVMDLEAQLAQAERDPARSSKPGHAPGAFNGASQGASSVRLARRPTWCCACARARAGGSAASGTRLLPRAPAQSELAGHRSLVTCVALHPKFNTAASSSEDATIKIWDCDGAELERTLKGHTQAVQHVAFDDAGNMLGSQLSRAQRTRRQ